MKLPKYILYAWLGVFVFVALIVAYVFEFQWIANTFNAKGLIIKSILVMVAIGLFFRWKWRHLATDAVTSMQLWMSCLLIPALFGPLLGSLGNRVLSPFSEEKIQVEFFQEQAFMASAGGFLKGEKLKPTGYYLFVLHNGQLVRLRSKTSLFGGVQRGEKVELRVKRGLFGHLVFLE